ncbi:MAG: LTA synthase family protein [Bacteroidales bacterium]|nr:LTA synthase family protein [Bacteroidales bacterium]
MIFFIVLNILICIGDIGLNLTWGSKINARALEGLAYPKEAAGLIFSKEHLLLYVVIFLQCVLWIYVYLRFMKIRNFTGVSNYKKIIFSVLLVFLCITGIRGGFQKYPIDKDWAYYSTNSTLNNASLNSFWNFAEIFVKKQVTKNPYNYFSKEESDEIFNELCPDIKDTTEIITNTNRPNIILIIIESLSADAVGCMDGEKNITPGMDLLSKSAYLFTNFYATGFRTDQGILALLSGFPAQPQNSVIKDFGKFEKLPNLISVFKNNNYYTSYYCGGKLWFANTDVYLRTAGIDKLIGENDFKIKRKTLWGAYDEELYDFHLNDIKNSEQPFFSAIITSTSHEWFDADVENIFGNNNNCEKYKNTIHYADKCLMQYLQKAKQKEWYKNTLFIITADHAHSFPKNRNYNQPGRHHIPFVLYGDVLKKEYCGKKNNKIASHIDFAATILSQLNIYHGKFRYSKNIFNKYSAGFAFYTFDNGFGFIDENQTIVFDHNLKKTV